MPSQIQTGKFKGDINEFKKAIKSLTPFDLEELGITDDTALVDASKALSARLALELRNPAGGAGMPGALSDKDREFLQSMVASVETTPEAIPLMIEAAVKLQQRNQEVAKLAREYRRQNNRSSRHLPLLSLTTSPRALAAPVSATHCRGRSSVSVWVR